MVRATSHRRAFQQGLSGFGQEHPSEGSRRYAGTVHPVAAGMGSREDACLFPLMKANLSIYPITATETQLDFNSLYEPLLLPLGKAMNAMVGAPHCGG